jgi:hypothetical protein
MQPALERASTLSYLQRRVVTENGWPDTFTLLFYAEHEGSEAIVRHETWRYHAKGKTLTFVTGGLLESASAVAVSGTAVPRYRPDQFQVGMSFEDVARAIAMTDFVMERMPGEDMVTFWADQIVLGFVDDNLVYVETRPRGGTARQGGRR